MSDKASVLQECQDLDKRAKFMLGLGARITRLAYDIKKEIDWARDGVEFPDSEIDYESKLASARRKMKKSEKILRKECDRYFGKTNG